MAINLKAKETLIQVGELKGKYRYVLGTELYNKLSESKVIKNVTSGDKGDVEDPDNTPGGGEGNNPGGGEGNNPGGGEDNNPGGDLGL